MTRFAWTIQALVLGCSLLLAGTTAAAAEATPDAATLRESVPAGLVARIRNAAERGEAGAAFELGMLSRHGRGLERNPEQARRWLARAADAGVATARRELGRLGIEDQDAQRQREGATLLAAAADAGDAEAQYLHGRALQFGVGMAVDGGQARRRFEQAALQGHVDARLALAQSLWRGSRADRDQALAWLLWPAGDQPPGALRSSARAYARGADRRMPADPGFALLLASIAAELDANDAGQIGDTIAAEVDADQRREVHAAMERWASLRARPHPQLAWREAMARAGALRRDDPEAAREHAARAEAAAIAAFGEQSLPRAEAIELRCAIARQERDAAGTRSACDQALAVRLALQPEDHPDVIFNRWTFASVYGSEHAWSEQADLLAELLPRASRRHGEGSTELQALLADLGNALYFADRHGEAVPHLRRALELALRNPLQQQPALLARARDELARALAKAGDTDEAVALLHESIDALRAAGPDSGPELHSTLERLVLVLWGADRVQQAAERQSELIALLEAATPNDLQRIGTERRILEAIRADAASGSGAGTPDRKTLEAAAEGGDAMAQLLLANHLLTGSFGTVDAEGAAHWYRQSAENGEAIAQYNLAILLGEGRGLARDPAEALAWVRRAAAQDFPDALSTLGYYLTDGEGGDDDPEEAVRLFERAAAMGSHSAMFNLGNHLMAGNGVEQDVERGLALYRRAAEGREPAAVRTLALMQVSGEHLPMDPQAGREQLLHAARLGDQLAHAMVCSLARDGAVQWKEQRIEMPAGSTVEPELVASCGPGVTP